MQFYLQAAVVEKGTNREQYRVARWDVIVGCLFANLVAIFIMVACGATLGKAGIHVDSAAEAAIALKPFAGKYATLLFSFGLFTASLFAASILPLSTAYTICEGLGFEASVNKTFREAPHFYGLYTAILVLAALSVLWPHFPLFDIMVFSQVMNGLLLPAIMYFVINLASNPEIMGNLVNPTRLRRLGFLAMAVVIFLNLLLIGSWIW